MDPLIVDLSALYGKTSFVYHISFLAPKDKPFLQMWARVWYARSDRLRIDPKLVTSFSPAELAGCSSRIATYRLLDESKIKGLVQKPRYITYQGGNTGTAYSLAVQGDKFCVNDEDLARYFGVTYNSSHQQEWLVAK